MKKCIFIYRHPAYKLYSLQQHNQPTTNMAAAVPEKKTYLAVAKATMAKQVVEAVEAVKAVEAAKTEARFVNSCGHLKTTAAAGIPNLGPEDLQAAFKIVMGWLLNSASEAFYTILADGNGEVEIDCVPLARELAKRTITIEGVERPMGMFRAWHLVQHIVLGRTPGFCSNDTKPHLEMEVDFTGVDMRLPVSTTSLGKAFSALPHLKKALGAMMADLFNEETREALPWHVGLRGTAQNQMEPERKRVEFFDRTLSIVLYAGDAAEAAKAAEKHHSPRKSVKTGGAAAGAGGGR